MQKGSTQSRCRGSEYLGARSDAVETQGGTGAVGAQGRCPTLPGRQEASQRGDKGVGASQVKGRNERGGGIASKEWREGTANF